MTTEELQAKAREVSDATHWTPWLRFRQMVGETIRRLFNLPFSLTGRFYRRGSAPANLVEGDSVAALRSRELWGAEQACWSSCDPPGRCGDNGVGGYREYTVHLGLEPAGDIPVLSPYALRHELERRLEDWPGGPFRWYVRSAECSTGDHVAKTEED